MTQRRRPVHRKAVGVKQEIIEHLETARAAFRDVAAALPRVR